jgi:hypothetical protein
MMMAGIWLQPGAATGNSSINPKRVGLLLPASKRRIGPGHPEQHLEASGLKKVRV